jgi:hypothetical protein
MVKLAGKIPTTVISCPFSLIALPSSFGSAPKRLRHVRSVTIATGAWFGLLSSAVNMRPAKGFTFSADKTPSVAMVTMTLSDCPPTERTALSLR